MRQPDPSPEAVRRTLAESRDLCVLAYEVAELPLDRIATRFRGRPPAETVRRVAEEPASILPLLVVAAPPEEPGTPWELWSGYVEYAALREADYTHAWAVVVHECYRVALHARPQLEPEMLPTDDPDEPGEEDMEGMEWVE